MYLTKRTLAAVVLLFINVSTAPAQVAPQYEKHLKVLEPFVGIWEGKYDPPGDPPMGTVRVEITWIGNKSYLLVRGIYTPDGVDGIEVNPTNMVFGYDEKTKSIRSWYFGIEGVSEGPAKVFDDRLETELVGRVPDEVPSRFKATIRLNGAEQITIVNTDRIATGGAKRPDDPPLVAKRVKKK